MAKQPKQTKRKTPKPRKHSNKRAPVKRERILDEIEETPTRLTEDDLKWLL